MRLIQINNSIVLYNINTVKKLDFVRDDLMNKLQIMDNHKVMNGMSIKEYERILRQQIETKYEKFRLFVALDTKNDYKVVGYTAAFIVVDDNQSNGCLIYGAYFAPMLLKTIFPYIVYYLDVFASQYDCQDMLFSTSRSAKAYTRLLRNINFKPTHTIFRRKIPDVEYIRKAV